MQEIPVRFLGREDPPGEGKGCPLQYSGLENSMDYTVAESESTEWLSLSRVKSKSRILRLCDWEKSLVAQRLKRLPPMQETWVWSLGREDPLEKEMVTHSSILAWRIPWTEEPGGLQSTGSQESDTTLEQLHFSPQGKERGRKKRPSGRWWMGLGKHEIVLLVLRIQEELSSRLWNASVVLGENSFKVYS